ncbi:hypothetical protein P168DRAFT_234528 [Aspergillus campestris IBT 28561]|uniref:Uncharacterized protein n=1 Tax=Aspergillus campestris (strain IBT 28561) TaxID=1392248 RepID=A0A2I1D4U4_ASPC2|nr:uncharacterized protein P168DRAFT_234528 [Aspergillus campestris IBT 28561]PKY04907.1 hypothetical protein P168DRAFT_234528 [Aspergillus campestris IBT 28561]
MKSPISDCPKWENPSFAYFNNQFILHLASAVNNPLPTRKLLSPGITIPAVRGVQSEKHVPVTDIFDGASLNKLGYETSPAAQALVGDDTTPTLQVDHYTEITDSPSHPIVQATAATESYWQWSAIRFTAEAFLLPFTGHRWRSAAQHFQLAEPLQRCVDSLLPEIMPHAIAMHLRMWPSDLSFGQKDPCHTNEVPVLKHVFSKCDWSANYLYQNVQRVQTSASQPVVIATDDRKHPAVVDLIARLGDRAHFMEPTGSCAAALNATVPENERKWRAAAYWPILEAATMVQAEAFVGSFWSTFSQLIAVRRMDTSRTYFVQNRAQAFLWWYRWGLISSALGVAAVLTAWTFKRYSRSRRASMLKGDEGTLQV